MSIYSHRNLFGGKGEVTVHQLLAEPACDPFHSVLWCSLEPYGSVGSHHQATESELLIVTSGAGRAVVDGTEIALSSGVVVTVPLGSALALINDAEALLEYLIVKAAPRRPKVPLDGGH